MKSPLDLAVIQNFALEIAKSMAASKEIHERYLCSEHIGEIAYRIAEGLHTEQATKVSMDVKNDFWMELNKSGGANEQTTSDKTEGTDSG